MPSIKKIHKAEYRPIADLITYCPLPSRELQMIDPFLLLNHHGPQKYAPNNCGLPFGPHPHRGMETLTFILEGDIAHRDSDGHKSIIQGGGVQWMSAGSGLIHSEVSFEDFKKGGGSLEILQLWLNLPAKLKMKKPQYQGFQKEQIPEISLEQGKIRIQVVSGDFRGTSGAFQSSTHANLSLLFFKETGRLDLRVPKENNIFFYMIKGELLVNQQAVKALDLVEFENDGEDLSLEAPSESILLFGHAAPLNEPVIARGPFVMNTTQEINQAYKDYESGKFGQWQD